MKKNMSFLAPLLFFTASLQANYILFPYIAWKGFVTGTHWFALILIGIGISAEFVCLYLCVRSRPLRVLFATLAMNAATTLLGGISFSLVVHTLLIAAYNPLLLSYFVIPLNVLIEFWVARLFFKNVDGNSLIKWVTIANVISPSLVWLITFATTYVVGVAS